MIWIIVGQSPAVLAAVLLNDFSRQTRTAVELLNKCV